jgi:hypothetical protein
VGEAKPLILASAEPLINPASHLQSNKHVIIRENCNLCSDLCNFTGLNSEAEYLEYSLYQSSINIPAYNICSGFGCSGCKTIRGFERRFYIHMYLSNTFSIDQRSEVKSHLKGHKRRYMNFPLNMHPSRKVLYLNLTLNSFFF